MLKRVSFWGATLAAIALVGAGCGSSAPTPTAPVAPTAPAAAPAPAPAAVAPAAATFAVGDHVLADWKKGDQWWDAKVTGVGSGGADYYLITYTSDNSTDMLTAADLAHYPTAPAAVTTGAKVVAKWTDGKWYGGTVGAVTSAGAQMTWSDGSQTTVALTDIAWGGK